jgi:hypothetical protein
MPGEIDRDEVRRLLDGGAQLVRYCRPLDEEDHKLKSAPVTTADGRLVSLQLQKDAVSRAAA